MAQQPLFGYSPEQIMQARQAAMQERAAAEASRVGGGWAPLYEQARGLSMMGAEALGRGLFPQAQDPALQRAQVTQSIVQKYRGQDFNSPSVLSQMASEFSQAGIPEVAMQLSDKVREITPKTAQRSAKDQAELATFTINQIPEDQRTEEQNRILNAAASILRSESGGDKVQSTKILEDGTTVTVYNSGKREVTGPQGNVLTGDAAAKAVKDAAQFGITIAGGKQATQTLQRLQLEAQFGAQVKGAEAAGAQAIKISGEAFTSLNKVQTNINNLKEAKTALEKGANTGAIASRLPSLTAASIELDNIRNRLGLDIVGSVTFGALSEGELGLALNTGLPTNLPEKDLKDYIIRKIDAQDKLSKYLTDQARFLSKPGNTLNDWLESQETKKPKEGSKGTSGRSSGAIQRTTKSGVKYTIEE
jgi:hypothetical protein